MTLIASSDDAVAKAIQWLEKNAPEYVEEVVVNLLRALEHHNQVANLQSVLNSQFGELFDQVTEIFPLENVEGEQAEELSTRIMKISKTNELIQDVREGVS